MNITSRTTMILKFILEKKITTIATISTYFDLSYRIIKYELEYIEFLLNFIDKTLNFKISYGQLICTINDYDQNKIINFFKSFERISRTERIDYILLNLIISKDINITSLSKILKVSRTTIKKDLEVIKIILNNHKLEIVYFKKYYIQGEKKNKNILTIKIINKYIQYFKDNSYQSLFIETLIPIFNDEVFLTIKNLTAHSEVSSKISPYI